MRMSFAADSLNERVGLALGKVPVPVGMSFFGMPAARSLQVAQKTGVFAALAQRPMTAEEVASACALRERHLRIVLDMLAGGGLVDHRDGRYALSRAGRAWLDPSSPTYVGSFVEHSGDYWDWWADLERTLVEGPHAHQSHDLSAGDPAWRLYIRGQFELARLSSAEVAKALPAARSVLDVAGGHGEFAAAICRRHPEARATVLDLPGSAAIGREIMREAGMADRVTHVDGDMFASDLGGPHDIVLLCSIVHHLDADERVALLERIRPALAPRGVVAVLDMFRPDPGRPPVFSGAVFELFFGLTSARDVPSERELAATFRAAGFTDAPKRRDLRTIPDYRLYTAGA